MNLLITLRGSIFYTSLTGLTEIFYNIIYNTGLNNLHKLGGLYKLSVNRNFYLTKYIINFKNIFKLKNKDINLKYYL